VPATEPQPEPTITAPDSRRSRRRLPPPSLRPESVRRLLAGLAVLLVGAIGFGAGWLVFDDPDEPAPPAAIAPTVVIRSEDAPQPEAAEEIGFPAFATRNTTRVAGADSVATGAGVALASYPSLGGVGGPAAVIVAPADSWQEALAATPLTAAPIEAPLLLSDPDEVPDLTTQALDGLAPQGLENADGAQLITVGDVAVPEGFEALAIDGADAAEIGRLVDAERARLTGERDPAHLLVVSSADAGLAMPAAAWAARSGDPILFADGGDVPEATAKVVRKHPRTPIYVLGPTSAISAKAVATLEKNGAAVTRVGNEGPVENSIAFARFVDGDFGWNINDPGHGFTIANVERPLDAAVGAPLAAGGKPGPLLVTTDSELVSAPLQGFLSDTQPGFLDDPSRAVYNHVWLLGDSSAISVPFQAQVDELTKLAPVRPGTGPVELGPTPGQPEDEGRGGSANGGGGPAKRSRGDSGPKPGGG